MRVMDIIVPATPPMKAASFASWTTSTGEAWLTVEVLAGCTCLQSSTYPLENEIPLELQDTMLGDAKTARPKLLIRCNAP